MSLNNQKEKQALRLAKGGIIDRQAPLSFHFNGKAYQGYQGDSLASALIANGVKLVGRSFKYHRPRGIFTAGVGEPNALMTLHEGAKSTPNIPATNIELSDGLIAASQNHKGPLHFDVMRVNDYLKPFLAAGFYYKTFMWPKSWWESLYEPTIRKAAGLGALSMLEDPDQYEKANLHCDLLVIGAGPAGLMAAEIAAKSGARVIIADEDFHLGGRLLSESHKVNGMSGIDWVAQQTAVLESYENVRIMRRCCVFGAYDHGIYGALEDGPDGTLSPHKPRQTLYHIYAGHAILASGALERGMAFGQNDRPNIMLAGAVRCYVNRFATLAGRQVTIFTNNDDGWRTAYDLLDHHVQIEALIDSRDVHDDPYDLGGQVRIIKGASITNTKANFYDGSIKAITLSTGETIITDLLAISGGWSPNLALTCHKRGRPIWNEKLAAFLPHQQEVAKDALAQSTLWCAGAVNGQYSLSAAMREGAMKAKAALKTLGFMPPRITIPKADDEPFEITPFWYVKEGEKKQPQWIDYQNDVKLADLALANQEGYRSVEHAKRYTTMGMATDQGKMANVLGIGVMAELQGKTMDEIGTTIYRPPYQPVAFGAFAGKRRGKGYHVMQNVPSHKYALEKGASFVEAGTWMRPEWYAKPHELPSHENWLTSVNREVLATRRSLGLCDVSTLGKIDLQGKGALNLLNLAYVNGFSNLQIGKTRYGLMLREDGIALDDGTVARFGENHYVISTTTVNAGKVFHHLEFMRQCLLADQEIKLTSITDGWAQFAIAGVQSRAILNRLFQDKYDLSNEAFPFMACGEFMLEGTIKARLFRISFSGELAYEIAVPTRYGEALFRRLMALGKSYDITPYGLEALNVMRIEKGHPTANELNGQTNALDLGMARMCSKKKDYIGAVMSKRPAMLDESRPRLVGIKPENPNDKIGGGAHLFEPSAKPVTEHDLGWVSSMAYSPNLESYIALAFVKDGIERMGQTLTAHDPVRQKHTRITVTSPHFFDPEGHRLKL